MSITCNNLDKKGNQYKWNQSVKALYKKWNSNKNITDVMGVAGEDTDGNRAFEEIFFNVTGMAPSDVPQGRFFDSQFKLVEKEIDRLSVQLKSPRYSPLLAMVGTTTANLEATPQSKNFLNEIRQTSNFESSQLNRMLGYTERIRKNLVSAIMEESDGNYGVYAKWKEGRALKKIEDVEAQLAAAVASKDPGAPARVAKYSADLEALTATHGGKVNRIFVAMMDNYNVNDLINLDQKGEPIDIAYTDRDGLQKQVKITNRSIIAAAIEAKSMMRDMGYNLARALSGFSEFTKMTHDNGVFKDMRNDEIINSDKSSNDLRNRLKMIDEAQASLQESIKTGKYFPHYILNANINLMSGLSKVASKYRDLKDFKAHDTDADVAKIFENLADYMPNMAKARATDSIDAYHTNALGVLKQYSSDVIAFNKLVYSQNALVKAFNNIPRGQEAGRGWQGIREMMLKTFSVHTEGYSNRDPNINNIVRTVTAFEFVSKMGFGVTTAARNAASMTFFIHHVGWGNWNHLGRQIKENQQLRSIIDDVSKNHVGFMFGVDVSQISQGGVNKTEGISMPTVKESGSNAGELEAQQISLASKAINTGIDATVRVGGVLQSVTENWMRREMFERMFAQHYMAFSKHPNYMTAQRLVGQYEQGTKEYEDATVSLKQAQDDLKIRSANYALQMVDAWAFNYDPSSKAPIAGGTTSNAGALGQIMMQFMHYPMEFTFRQAKQASGAARAFGSTIGSDDSYRQRLSFLMNNKDMRGAVLTLMSTVITGYLTALTGSNIAGLFENATVEKGQALYQLLTGDDEEQKNANYGRGIINLFTGPLLSDIMTIGMAQGILELPENEMTQMLLGFNNFIENTDDENFHAQLRTLQPHMYNIATKDIPNFVSGNVGKLLERNLAMAPNKETLKKREEMMGNRGGEIQEFINKQKLRQQQKQTKEKIRPTLQPQAVQAQVVQSQAVQPTNPARTALQMLRPE